MKICEYCGKEFEPPSNYKKQKYCCLECYNKSQRVHETDIIKICEYCGEEFNAGHRSDAHKRRFCCKSCSSKSTRGNAPRPTNGKKNRPLTPDTAFFVKLWHEKGDSPEKIAFALNRDVEQIKSILSGELK